MNSLLGITVDPTMVYDPTGKEWRDKCKELESQVRELEVGEALHKVCIQQRNTEIKRADKAEAELKLKSQLIKNIQTCCSIRSVTVYLDKYEDDLRRIPKK